MIEQLVEQIEARFAELSHQFSDPEVIADRQRYAEVGRAYRELEPAAGLAEEWRRAVDDAAGARELLAEDGDGLGAPPLREPPRAASPRPRGRGGEKPGGLVRRDPH